MFHRWISSTVVATCFCITGCAAVFPIHGVPVEQLALASESRTDKATIDLSLLVQSRPDQYRVGPKDVLSVYVPGVLGKITDRDDEVGEAPPINQPRTANDMPTVGYPMTVRGDGTLPLPQTRPIYVQGMTLGEVEDAIRNAYTNESHVLNSERSRVLVSLARKRDYEVLVVRQEKSSEVAQAAPNVVNVGRSRRGTARMVRLPAYQNDVLHALAKEQGVDGLPGLDAENTIYIIRRRNKGDAWPASMHQPVCGPEAEAYSGSLPSGMSDLTPLPDPTLAAPGYMPGLSPVPQPSPIQQQGGYVAPQPYESSPQYGAMPYGTPSHGTTQYEAAQPAGYRVPNGAPNHVTPAYHQPGHSLTPLPAGANTPASIPAGYSPMRLQDPVPTVRGQSPGYRSEAFRNGAAFPGYGNGAGDPYAYADPVMPGHGVPSSSEVMLPGHGAVIGPQHMVSGDECLMDDNWSWQQELAAFDPTVQNPHVIKIPVRLSPGERPNFSESDIILEDGDIVFIESRDTEVFYTAGLLGGGQWELPRDYDLRLLEAISIAQGPQNVQQAGNSNGRSAINSDVTVSGSRIVIMRTLPGGARVPIETSIYSAIRNPDEHNIKIQPGDMIYVQYTCAEGVLAFFERNLLETALFGFAAGFATND